MTSRIPELVKRGWTFNPIWDESIGVWHIIATKRIWGLRHAVWSTDWDRAHMRAADWAESEERTIGEDMERPDTERAPAMVAE